MTKIPVKDEKGTVIAQVEGNRNLDFWDGQNYTCGKTGRHLGITYLRQIRKYVLIHETQWDGERDSAEIVSDQKAAGEIADKNPDLFNDPRFAKLRHMIINDDDKTDAIAFETSISKIGNSFGIIIPVEEYVKIKIKENDKVTVVITISEK